MFKTFPKVELHAHINGSVSDSTIKKLVDMKKKANPTWKPERDWEVVLDTSERTMEDAFKVFKFLHELCDTEKAAYLITTDVISEFESDGVKYLELRTTPRKVESTQMTKKSYIHAVLNAIKDSLARPECDIIVKLLLAIDRRTSLEDAWDTLKLADELNEDKNYKDIVVGLDLSGDPYKGDAKIFLPVFEAAKRKGYKLALHLSEVKDRNEETEAMLALPPDRIGHGTFLDPESGGSEKLVSLVRQRKIPIEFCFTSNIVTSTVNKASDHHFGFWYNQDHPCVICTDDKGVFATDLSKEWELASAAFKISKDEMWKLSFSSIEHIFADDNVKNKLRKRWTELKPQGIIPRGGI